MPDNQSFVDALGIGCSQWEARASRPARWAKRHSPCDVHEQYTPADVAIVRKQCPYTCGGCQPRLRRRSPPPPTQRGGLHWVWQPQSCSAAYSLLGAKLRANHDRTLILVPDSGWGDTLHALTSAMVMCAAFGRRCLVFKYGKPATYFHDLGNLTSPNELAGRSHDWWCLDSQMTFETRTGQPFGASTTQLEHEMPLWPTAKLAMVERGAAPWPEEGLEEYFKQHGRVITIASSNPAHSCVELHTGWASMKAFNRCRFNESSCKWAFLVGGNYHPDGAIHELAVPLEMSTFEVRRCAMRFALQFQPVLVERADRHLERARNGASRDDAQSSALSGVTAAPGSHPVNDETSSHRQGGDTRAVVIGIHIRAVRFYKELQSGTSLTRDGTACYGHDDSEFNRATEFETPDSPCYMKPEVFDPYADAARELERQYSDKHGAGRTFKWIVFTDSNALLPRLLQRWDQAVPLNMGKSSHSGCDAAGTSFVQWLMLSKCDMLVVSRSGFSMTAAVYADPMPPTVLVQSNNNGGSSLTYMDENEWLGWRGTVMGT